MRNAEPSSERQKRSRTCDGSRAKEQAGRSIELHFAATHRWRVSLLAKSPRQILLAAPLRYIPSRAHTSRVRVVPVTMERSNG
jgi:hypothetical protein